VMSLLGMIVFVAGMLSVILSVSKQWRMKPVSLMTKDSTRVAFNGLLFTLQFGVSIALTVCTITIIRQMDFLEHAPLGFNRNMIQLSAPDKTASNDLLVLKQKVAGLSTVSNVTVCSGNPISGNSVARYTLENGEFYSPYLFSGDDDFLKTLDLQLVEGELPTEHNKGKLVNQKLIQMFNLNDPVGQRIPGTDDIIRGVVKDFTCSSFKQEIPPVIISYGKEGKALLIDFKGHRLAELLPQLQRQWRAVFPDQAFTYRIIQEDLMRKYKEDTFFYRIMVAFSVVSLVLSCFGLFALSWAVTEARTKEMGVRKVLGATSLDILNLLTLLFTKRIAIGFVFAAPIGYYLMSQWLARFASRIELDIWTFILSVILVGVVAVLTLSLQTVKATLANPVDSLKNE
jgi:putative ABC transport system permease protein